MTSSFERVLVCADPVLARTTNQTRLIETNRLHEGIDSLIVGRHFGIGAALGM
jgi:hypothetical protein